MYKKSLGIISLGCDKNRVDTEEMLYNLCGYNFFVTQNISEAQIIIINTCAFIESARKESVEAILSAAEYKKDKLEKLIVTGCLPQKYMDDLKKELPEVDCFLGINDYGKIGQIVARLYGEDCSESVGKNDVGRVLTTPELYAYLKIADGCDNHCTFCTIPSIRGKYRSKPIETLVKETQSLISLHGTKEIILVAQDVTSYGKDIYGEGRLLELIQELSKTDIGYIRLMYCYPELITDALINEISKNPKMAKYIDVPLQHVDTGILKLMNRKSNMESICALIEKIRKIDDSIAIRTTFMVGFPSESEEQFLRLYGFVEKYGLEHVGIFAYSAEDDTPSARLEGHLPDEIKADRVERLGELHKRQTEEKNARLIGNKQKAIYYDIDYERNMFVARSQYNAPDIDSVIYFSSKKLVEFGEEYDITITDTDGFDLIGEVR